jgi:hypothetical protein
MLHRLLRNSVYYTEKPATNTTARQRRQLARDLVVLQAWWQSITPPAADFYEAELLAQRTGLSSPRLAAVLRAAGWLRAQRRIEGVAKIVWAPPNAPDPRRPIGRPPLS